MEEKREGIIFDRDKKKLAQLELTLGLNDVVANFRSERRFETGF